MNYVFTVVKEDLLTMAAFEKKYSLDPIGMTRL